MAKSALPLIVAGGAALLLLGGKKKKKTAETALIDEPSEEELDQGEGPDPEEEEGEGPGYGSVAKGVRTDRRGQHPWRVYYDADGYKAQLMIDTSRFSGVQGEVGVAASASAAKGMLRDHFNELLLEKYPNEKPKNDPGRRLLRQRGR